MLCGLGEGREWGALTILGIVIEGEVVCHLQKLGLWKPIVHKCLNSIAIGTLYLAFVSQARTYPRLDASLSKKMPHSKSWWQNVWSYPTCCRQPQDYRPCERHQYSSCSGSSIVLLNNAMIPSCFRISPQRYTHQHRVTVRFWMKLLTGGLKGEMMFCWSHKQDPVPNHVVWNQSQQTYLELTLMSHYDFSRSLHSSYLLAF